MIFRNETSLVSYGDFIDIYLKIKKKGISFIFGKLFKFTYKTKVSNKWDNFNSESDFWNVDEIRQHWNKLISSDKNVMYEQYISNKYFQGKTNLSLLSIGCGEGRHERNFYEKLSLSKTIGIDISAESIKKAQEIANKQNKNIQYECANFDDVTFSNQKFDIILFDSSLHHFQNIEQFLKNQIKPLLREEGLLVVLEYCGPNRLQWRDKQLEFCNKILEKLPEKYKYYTTNGPVKRKVYRPGLLRVYSVDPSEAPDSANLVDALHTNFDTVEEQNLGWNIIQPLLKGIAHNFTNGTAETKEWISFILSQEQKFLLTEGEKSDAIFGVYKLKT